MFVSKSLNFSNGERNISLCEDLQAYTIVAEDFLNVAQKPKWPLIVSVHQRGGRSLIDNLSGPVELRQAESLAASERVPSFHIEMFIAMKGRIFKKISINKKKNVYVSLVIVGVGQVFVFFVTINSIQ